MMQTREILPFQLDIISRQLTLPSKSRVRLTRTETQLLAVLLSNFDRVVSKDYLIECVWGDGGSDSALRNTIYRLRRKIEPASEEFIYLQQIGEGYGIFAP